MYNKLPREITLLPNLKLFKIWLKKYHMNKQISIPKREDNKKILERQKISEDNISQCEKHQKSDK